MSVLSVGTAHQAEITLNKVGVNVPLLWERIAESEDLARKFAVLALCHGEEFNVRVDYGKTLAEMVAACNCPLVDPNITSGNFPVEGSGVQVVTIRLFHFGRKVVKDRVLRDLRLLGHQPVRIEELLALGAAKPELQTRFPIVALGSASPLLYEEDHGAATGQGHCYVPLLELAVPEGKRKVGAEWDNITWNEECRFAAVRL